MIIISPPQYLAAIFLFSSVWFLVIESYRDIRKRLVDERNVYYLNGIAVALFAFAFSSGSIAYPLFILLFSIGWSIALTVALGFSQVDASLSRVCFVGLSLINPWKAIVFLASVMCSYGLMQAIALYSRSKRTEFPGVPFILGSFLVTFAV